MPRLAEEIDDTYRVHGLKTDGDPRIRPVLANSIRVRDDYFDVNPAFSKACHQYYDAEVRSRNFSLPATTDDINSRCTGTILFIVSMDNTQE